MDFLLSIWDKLPEYIGILVSILTGLITIFLFVKGDEPERTLQKIVDFLAKYSRK